MRRDLPRVAFVSHSPWLAGGERALFNLLENLPEEKISPVVIFPHAAGPMKEAVREKLKLPILSVPYEFSLPIRGSLFFNKRLREEIATFLRLYRELELDAVVVNTSVVYSAAAAALLARIPLLVHSHGAIFPRLFPGLDLARWNKLDSLQLNMADTVLVPSRWVAKHYQQAYNLPEEKVKILPNGTRLPSYDHDENFVNSSPIPQLVMLCTMEPNKGVLTFLTAASSVLALQPNIATFVVYGDGPPEYMAVLAKFISEHKMEKNCFLKPKQTDINSIYRNCAVAVIASEVESFSFVAIEAMSHARPVISTRCGGPEDIVIDNETGYLIPIGDSNTLAQRMSDLINDPKRRRRMGLSGRMRVESVYNIRKVSENYLTAILNVVRDRRSPNESKNVQSYLTLAMREILEDGPSMPMSTNTSTIDLTSREQILFDALSAIGKIGFAKQ